MLSATALYQEKGRKGEERDVLYSYYQCLLTNQSPRARMRA